MRQHVTNSRRLVAAAALLVAVAAACSKGGLLDKKKGDSAAATTDPDDEADGADHPAQVAGAFLTHCSNDAALPDVDADLQAMCVIEDKDSHRLDATLTTIEATVTTVDGASSTATARPVSGSPWHFGLVLPAPAGKIKEIDFHYTYQDQGADRPDQGSVSDLAYDWAHDPIFAGILATFGAKAQPLAAIPADAAQLVFVTDAVYKGDFGKDAADKHCSDAGAKVDKTRKWIAVLSTSTASARDRVKIAGHTYSVMGQRLAVASTVAGAEDADWNKISLFDKTLATSIRYTETGRSANAIDLTLDPPRIISRIWMGSDAHGHSNATEGTCKDWTSAAADVTGAAGSTTTNHEGTWQDAGAASCDEVARLLCISQ